MQLLTLFTFLPQLPTSLSLHEQTGDEVINFIFWHTSDRTRRTRGRKRDADRRHDVLDVTRARTRTIQEQEGRKDASPWEIVF